MQTSPFEGPPRRPAAPVEEPAISGPLGRYLPAFKKVAGDRGTGMYLVGSPALGDFSPRQSNIDLVALTPQPLTEGQLRELSSTHRALRLNGRDAAVLYTTWDALQGPPDPGHAAMFLGPRAADPEGLANPMTWAILARSPRAVHGPEAPGVHDDAEALRSWFAARLPAIVERTGRLLWRRHLARIVLHSTRCAYGALTGEVASLRAAGEWALPGASHTSHRVITDALGYREGANTSMYWGPFERKTNAVTLADDWLRRVQAARG